MTTLVVVAQRAEARFFLHDGPGVGLAEIADLVHPESRAHGMALETDRPGRVHERNGPTRHAMAPGETAKEHEATVFSKEVAEAILARRTHEGFDRLVLVAEPGFLGMLRGALDGPTAAMVHGEVRKNLTKAPVEQIAESIAHLFPIR
ncbi:MAG: host attachment protein [Myxococcales bacterium]|nr:host attachment protein [Myxococcales bacterium]